MGGSTEELSAARAESGRLLHTIHATRDDDALRRAYIHIFGGQVFAESYHAGEDRDMSLIYVADHMVEPMAPRRPDAVDTVFSRYLAKYGPGWHSIAIQVPDAAEAARRLRARGCEITTEHPGFFFVHPRSSGGIVVEVVDVRMTNDPHDEPSWNPAWAAARPHQPGRFGFIACVVRDLAPALHFFTGMFDGEVVSDEHVDWPQPARAVRISLADGHFLLIEPDDQATGPLGDWLAGPVSGLYALAWEVGDLDRTAAWFGENNVPLSPAGPIREARLEGARHWLIQAQSRRDMPSTADQAASPHSRS